MGYVVALANEWDSGTDPVPYYTDDPDGCLDLNSSKAKPRSVLQEADRKMLQDCEHHVPYAVVVCRVN